MHSRESESSGRQKVLCLGTVSLGETQRRLFAGSDERGRTSLQTSYDSSYGSQNFRDGSRRCSLVLQKEFAVDGARVIGIDVSSSILVISGKAPGVGREHVLSKVSLLVPNEIDRIRLPSNTGAIRDMYILSNQLALVASLGKKLSLFSMSSNNCVLEYDLPGPAWSCSGDLNSPYHIYAGLQNGMLLVFDMRQTARHLECMEGLSRHPVHTIHSILDVSGTRKVLSASSLGPCVWHVGGSGERPFLIPGVENQGVCISLASGSSSDYIVASFRPKVEFSNDGMPSQASSSPSPTVSGPGRLGSHVLMKRVNGASYQRHAVAYGNVSEARMSKSAIVSQDNSLQFAYGDESSHGVCLWDLPSFQVNNHLKPHPRPILDLKYAHTSGPGFLGCVSEDVCQVFTCF
ncbi:E3 ubiquitin-protein ligase RFWD3-like [Iris pallida]|uniref:RING-type E3 ubiquitin transferase n=1 Tax=Iris pallida TaxID=29817 RepID=A0AAX6IF56_IRIPA|nr:E3 ubiquitin-protein ligase RFWD3-like [Iris pallida]